jgi:cysteine synthase
VRAEDVTRLVGATPLVRLAEASEATGALVLGKLEARNPSGSLKDRGVLAMLLAARRDGQLAAGGAAVVASAGNSGLSLAVLAPLLGHPAVVVAPASAPVEWRRLCAGLGAELVLTPPGEGMGGAVRRAQAEARTREGAWLAAPFADVEAPEGYRAMGEEIWRDLDGRVDRVVVGVGTGATAAGLAAAFAAHGGSVALVGVEPAEAPNLSGRGGGTVHHIAGIGAGIVPPHWQTSGLSASEAVSSSEAMAECRRLAAEEGLLVGPSSGATVLAARRVAKAGEVVVAVLADGGERYLAQLGFLADEGAS